MTGIAWENGQVFPQYIYQHASVAVYESSFDKPSQPLRLCDAVAKMRTLRARAAPESVRRRDRKRPVCSNIVCNAWFGRRMPLKKISEQLEHAEWEPWQFPPAKLRHYTPSESRLAPTKTTVSVYRNGKVVSTPARTPATALLGLQRHRRALSALVPGMQLRGFRIVNRVYTTHVGHPLSIRRIVERPEYVDPDNFIALNWHPTRFVGLNFPRSNMTMKVFDSGATIMLGVDSEQAAVDAWDTVQPGLARLYDANRPEAVAARFQYRQEESERIGDGNDVGESEDEEEDTFG